MRWLNIFLLIDVSLLASADYASSSKKSAEVATPTEGTGISAEPIKSGDEERNALIDGGFVASVYRVLGVSTNKMKRLQSLKRRSDSADDVFAKWVAHKYPFIKDDRIDAKRIFRLFNSAGMRHLADIFEYDPDKLIKMFVNYYGPVLTANMISALATTGGSSSKMATAWINLMKQHWKSNPSDLAAVQKASGKGLTKEATSVLASFEKSQEKAAQMT